MQVTPIAFQDNAWFALLASIVVEASILWDVPLELIAAPL